MAVKQVPNIFGSISFSTDDVNIKVKAQFVDGGLFMTPQKIAEFLGVKVDTVDFLINKMYLQRIATKDCKIDKYGAVYFGLSTILQISYKINNSRCKALKKWYTKILYDFIKIGDDK